MEAIHLHSINRRVMRMSWAVTFICARMPLSVYIRTYVCTYLCAVLAQRQCIWQRMLHGTSCQPPSPVCVCFRSRLQGRVSELERLLLSAESDRASCQREALQATEVLATMRSTNEEVSCVAGCSGGCCRGVLCMYHIMKGLSLSLLLTMRGFPQAGASLGAFPCVLEYEGVSLHNEEVEWSPLLCHGLIQFPLLPCSWRMPSCLHKQRWDSCRVSFKSSRRGDW